ncbi:hypothetical protein D9M69_572340 [compost metagenome]
MMPTITRPRALRPLATSSCPTCGPTNSERRNATAGFCAFRAASTASLCCPELLPACTGRRSSTSRAEPKFCTGTSA